MSESTPPRTLSTPSPADLFDRSMPPGYRAELLALEAETPTAVMQRTGSILLFQLGGLSLALPTKVASAVAPVLHIARIPHRTGTVLMGVVAFRGEILPCCSLARILDLSAGGEQSTATARTLILEESPERRWAVPIDGVFGVRSDPSEYLHVPAGIDEQWVQGSLMDGDVVFHLLDPMVLFRQITLATA